MANDPAFLFYPGDYLRDTQCLSEPVQVAYDRIICEHMRNICISKSQLNFFTKRLNNEQKDELMMVLSKVDGGFQINWVVDSILKRRAYSDSRRKNRVVKNKKHMKNISKSYDEHMDIDIENEIEDENKEEKERAKKEKIIFPFSSDEFMQMWEHWKIYRKAQDKFSYKSVQSEQAALSQLATKSKGFEDAAIGIIRESMANGWKGFFELKTTENGKQPTGGNVDTRTAFEKIDRMLSKT